MESLYFRSITLADISAITQIEQATQPIPWTEQIFTDCLKVGYQGWVLALASETVGFVLVSVAAGESHILDIAISPNHQRKGYGKYLMQQLLKELKQQQVMVVFLEVRISNIQAQGLYKKLGFSEIGRRKDYYQAKQGREDAIVMSLNLATNTINYDR
jgi:[ribosomal protein S18]-alanine N-acetyltransferase